MKKTILIVDDEAIIRNGLAAALDSYICLKAADGNEAWTLIQKQPVDLVITDLRMPKLSGEGLLKKIRSSFPALPVIVLTAHGTIELSVELMKNGAVDFLTKPVDLDALEARISSIFRSDAIIEQNNALKAEIEEFKKKNILPEIVGTSPAIRNLKQTIAQVAPTMTGVLVTGESGTGKELVSHAIHTLSRRSKGPFVAVNCSAYNENLLESELFGHEKGAFTGAISQKKGCFERAQGGTLFLDEIGEISPGTQTKLLRVLQEKEFERVGGEMTIKADVRIVAATNRNLKKEVEEGRFREDLYYRLKVVEIHVPPLRERKEDILVLATEFLNSTIAANRGAKSIEGFSEKAKNALFNHEWKGNVRELQNCVENAYTFASGPFIELENLPPELRNVSDGGEGILIPFGTSMDDAEMIIIRSVLARNGGNRTKAAEQLGLSRKTLFRKLREEDV